MALPWSNKNLYGTIELHTPVRYPHLEWYFMREHRKGSSWPLLSVCATAYRLIIVELRFGFEEIASGRPSTRRKSSITINQHVCTCFLVTIFPTEDALFPLENFHPQNQHLFIRARGRDLTSSALTFCRVLLLSKKHFPPLSWGVVPRRRKCSSDQEEKVSGGERESEWTC